MLRQALQTELIAANFAAAEAGLGAVTAQLLHLGNHTTVRLNPWPIVARIASGTSFDFTDDSLARELEIGRHLAKRGASAVRPTALVPPGPYMEKECAVTLWQFVDGRPITTEDDARLAAASLREVQAALLDFEGDLPSFLTKVESCEIILAKADEAPKLPGADRQFLLKLYDKLRAELNTITGPWQPLHGDTHLDNVVITNNSDAVWMDLESVCMGPIEWDVAGLGDVGSSEFKDVDQALVRLLRDVRALCVAVWCWAEFDRSAASRDAAIYHVEELKGRFS